jgi:hypothetical protein
VLLAVAFTVVSFVVSAVPIDNIDLNVRCKAAKDTTQPAAIDVPLQENHIARLGWTSP